MADTASTVLRCGCKINLFLRVKERLANGYHVLDSLFLPLDEPHDLLELRRLPEGRACRVAFVDHKGQAMPDIDPGNNTLTRALAWHAEKTGLAPALDILVRKGIPHGAGLGGGSSDAAALLRHLQAEAGQNAMPDNLLREQSAAVGADLPFFLLNRPARAGGVGERLTPCPNPFAGQFLLLLCPRIAVSTAWAFAELDRRRALDGVPARAKDDLSPPAASDGYVNDFEEAVFARHPELARLHKALCASGAGLARMSGTGSALFGVYREEKNARQAAKRLASPSVRVYMHPLPAH